MLNQEYSPEFRKKGDATHTYLDEEDSQTCAVTFWKKLLKMLR